MSWKKWEHWTEDEDNILEQGYAAGMSIEQIACALGRTPNAVKGRARFKDLLHAGYTRVWTEEEDNLLEEKYAAGTPLKEIARRLRRSTDAIQVRAQRKGYRHGSRGHYQETIRHDYFSAITSLSQAYMLGLLAADGCVLDSHGGHRIKLELQIRDIVLVELFRDTLAPAMPIAIYRNKAYIAVSSKKMVHDLAHYGIVPRKSLILEWPDALPDRFVIAFILGYFDGDGCLSYQKDGIRKYWHWSLLGTQLFLAVVRQHIQIHAQVEIREPRPHSKESPHIYRIETTGQKAVAIDRVLNASGLGLARKHLA